MALAGSRQQISYSNGDSYDGAVGQGGEKHGQGTYRYSTGDAYTGAFESDQKHGYGEYTTRDGDYYRGDWAFDCKLGPGDGYQHGDQYDGGFEEDGLGAGRIRFASGDTFDGQWFADGHDARLPFMHGEGLFTFVNGDWYEGQFHCDEFHGEGIRSRASDDGKLFLVKYNMGDLLVEEEYQSERRRLCTASAETICT